MVKKLLYANTPTTNVSVLGSRSPDADEESIADTLEDLSNLAGTFAEGGDLS